MKVLYFASLKERLKIAEEEIRLERPVTVREFLKKNLEPRLEGAKIENFLYAVNEDMVNVEYTLTDGDTLAILPPLSGGKA
ncbi:MAG: MoaD/ThiS family protein [Nitrospinota bacterium]